MDTELSIGQMAQLHNLSRQTLIYYHKLGLFIPQQVDERGNRIYSAKQIPFLREICTLKSLGVPLETIRLHLSEREPERARALLEDRRQEIEENIKREQQLLHAIENRLILYRKACSLKDEDALTLEHLPRRRAMLEPWRAAEPDSTLLHMATVRARKRLCDLNLVPSGNMGSILKMSSVRAQTPLAGAGSFLIVPESAPELEEFVELPEGDYLCMYKTSMPYRSECVYYMLDAADKLGYKLRGDVIDVCLLDTTFYEKSHLHSDLCQLQIRICNM